MLRCSTATAASGDGARARNLHIIAVIGFLALIFSALAGGRLYAAPLTDAQRNQKVGEIFRYLSTVKFVSKEGPVTFSIKPGSLRADIVDGFYFIVTDSNGNTSIDDQIGVLGGETVLFTGFDGIKYNAKCNLEVDDEDLPLYSIQCRGSDIKTRTNVFVNFDYLNYELLISYSHAGRYGRAPGDVIRQYFDVRCPTNLCQLPSSPKQQIVAMAPQRATAVPPPPLPRNCSGNACAYLVQRLDGNGCIAFDNTAGTPINFGHPILGVGHGVVYGHSQFIPRSIQYNSCMRSWTVTYTANWQ